MAVGVGVTAGSMGSTYSAEVEVFVSDLGPTPSQAADPNAPLLPDGATGLQTLHRTVAKRIGLSPDDVAGHVEVRDSDDSPAFDYDKTPGRRLSVLADAPKQSRADALALAFASAYVSHRANFYANREREIASETVARVDTRVAALGASVEAQRLELLPRTLTRAGEPGPHPVRDGLVAGIACVLLLVFIRVLRRPAP